MWYLQQRGLDPCRAADSIEAPSCTTAVAFHPVEPAQLVAGTFSGERQTKALRPCSLPGPAFVQYTHASIHLDSTHFLDTT